MPLLPFPIISWGIVRKINFSSGEHLEWHPRVLALCMDAAQSELASVLGQSSLSQFLGSTVGHVPTGHWSWNQSSKRREEHPWWWRCACTSSISSSWKPLPYHFLFRPAGFWSHVAPGAGGCVRWDKTKAGRPVRRLLYLSRGAMTGFRLEPEQGGRHCRYSAHSLLALVIFRHMDSVAATCQLVV